MNIRLCVVDDDPRVAEGLALLFRSVSGFRCEGCFQSAAEALAQIPALNPDVVLMDINLGDDTNGIQAVRELKRLRPHTQVLMLTVYEDSEKILQSLVAGASGYLLKRAPREQLLRAINEVQQGGAPFTSHIARRVVEYFHQLPATGVFEKLTVREQEVLEHLARGSLYKEISADLGIALDTVRKHICSIYEKLHVRSRSEAIAKYLNSRHFAAEGHPPKPISTKPCPASP